MIMGACQILQVHSLENSVTFLAGRNNSHLEPTLLPPPSPSDHFHNPRRRCPYLRAVMASDKSLRHWTYHELMLQQIHPTFQSHHRYRRPLSRPIIWLILSGSF